MSAKLAASILTADFARLGEEVAAAEQAGVDWIHMDVMDGQFVPNLSFGPLVAKALRRVTSLPLDVHLMVHQPENLIPAFAEAGAASITVQMEACTHLQRTVQQIRDLGVRPGVALNPATSLTTLDEILPELDMVLIMSVNPGFGGQVYLPGSTTKIARLRRWLHESGLTHIDIEVDGGIKADNAAEVIAAGASVLVIGSAVFSGRAPVAENVALLRPHFA
jgi:ribulose-phosphate 3-epimerase